MALNNSVKPQKMQLDINFNVPNYNKAAQADSQKDTNKTNGKLVHSNSTVNTNQRATKKS